MFRTRDFILFLVTAIFLLMAIGTTIFQSEVVPVYPPLKFAILSDKEFTAELYIPESISRADRVASLRRKIANSGDLVVLKPTISTNVELEGDLIAEEIASPEIALGLQQCVTYRQFVGDWPRTGLQFEMAEGVRIVYRSGALGDDDTVSQKQVLLQLPMYSVPARSVACIDTDVVGVATDGSLIRNNEIGLYGIFGAQTLVGYALDGFPIYGVSETLTDACGGVTVGGQYRYYLASDRQEVLHCFSSTPISL